MDEGRVDVRLASPEQIRSQALVSWINLYCASAERLSCLPNGLLYNTGALLLVLSPNPLPPQLHICLTPSNRRLHLLKFDNVQQPQLLLFRVLY